MAVLRFLPYKNSFRFTSLGSTYNTYPNPALRIGNDSTNSSSAMFKPAYELTDGSLERCGRVSAHQMPTQINTQKRDDGDRKMSSLNRAVSPTSSMTGIKIGQLHS